MAFSLFPSQYVDPNLVYCDFNVNIAFLTDSNTKTIKLNLVNKIQNLYTKFYRVAEFYLKEIFVLCGPPSTPATVREVILAPSQFEICQYCAALKFTVADRIRLCFSLDHISLCKPLVSEIKHVLFGESF